MLRFHLCSMLCLCMVLPSLALAAPDWQVFVSRKYHYSVRYPGDWHLLTTALRPTLDSLDILSFPPSERVEGVVLRDGGAEITVGPPARDISTIDQWIQQDTKANTEVFRQDLEPSETDPLGCQRIVEVTSVFEVGPDRYFDETTYYCRTDHGLYGATLLNWQGDDREDHWQGVALKMIESLRTEEQ